MRRSVSGVQKFFIDWSNHQIRERHGDCVTPEVERRGGIQQAIAKNTVAKKYKESLGLGSKTIFLCRGGSLPEEILQFLSGFDIIVHSVYGQSECCSLLTANIPRRFCKFSSVGKPCPGVSVRLGGEGEVNGSGRNIFMGYLNRESETKEKMSDDHWLRLGDHASIDEQGFFHLTGYPPDLITLFSGEEVEPSSLEDRVRMELACVAHCLVVGQGRERLAVLISLDTEVDTGGTHTSRLTQTCQAWFQAARFEVKTVAEVLDAMDLGIKHVIQAGIDRTNLEAERASQLISSWEILPQCLSLSTGDLGQTGKVNRAFVIEKYQRTITRMYTGEEYADPIPRKWSGEPFKVTQQLSQIVEDDEKSQRDSQEKTPVVQHRVCAVEEENMEDLKHNIDKVKISDKISSSNCEVSEDSDDEVTSEKVKHVATVEIPSKHDQSSKFEETIVHPEMTRRISRS